MRPSLMRIRHVEDVPALGEDEDEQQRRELMQLERRLHETNQRLKEIESKERTLTQAGKEITYSRPNQKRPRPDQRDGPGGELPNKRRVLSAVVSSQEGSSEEHTANEKGKEKDDEEKSGGRERSRGREAEGKEKERERTDRERDRSVREDRSSRKRGREERDSTGDRSHRHDDDEHDSSTKRRREAPNQSGGLFANAVKQLSAETTSHPRPKVPTVAPKEVQRTRKMFGVLLGTLQRFKKEEDTKTEKDLLREKVEEQVKNQVIEEHQQLVEKEREQIQKDKEEHMALKEALAKEIEEKEMNLLNNKWEKQRKLLSNPLFRKTTAHPCIYYSVNQSMKDVKMPPSPNVLSGDEEENGEEEEEEEEEDDVVTSDNVTVQAVESTSDESHQEGTKPSAEGGKEEAEESESNAETKHSDGAIEPPKGASESEAAKAGDTPQQTESEAPGNSQE